LLDGSPFFLGWSLPHIRMERWKEEEFFGKLFFCVHSWSMTPDCRLSLVAVVLFQEVADW